MHRPTNSTIPRSRRTDIAILDEIEHYTAELLSFEYVQFVQRPSPVLRVNDWPTDRHPLLLNLPAIHQR